MLIVVLAFGCAPGTNDDVEWSGTVDTLQTGVVRVANPAIGLWSSTAQLHEELRIGSRDGGPAEFDAVWDLAVDSQDRIYVLLTRRAEIRVFDAHGTFVRTVGRRGAGPGEFALPSKIALDPIDNLWVVDDANGRYAVYDSSGAFVQHYPRQIVGRCRPRPCGWFDRDGTFFDGGMKPLAPSVLANWVYPLGANLRPTDTIRLPVADSTPSTRVRPLDPYSARVVMAFAEDGHIWYAVNDNYELHALNRAGKLVRIISRDYDPDRLPDGDLREVAGDVAKFNRTVGVPGARMTLPDVRPLIAQIATDDRGQVWVATTHAGDGVTKTFDIFDTSGQYLGAIQSDIQIHVDRTSLPPMDPAALLIRRGNVYAITLDDDEVPYVVRLEIVAPVASGLAPSRLR